MFGLGTWEMVVIAVAALIVVGPEGLPKLLKMVAGLWVDVQKTADDIRQKIEEVGQQEVQRPELSGPVIDKQLERHEPEGDATEPSAVEALSESSYPAPLTKTEEKEGTSS
jgi:sec-independent protein translocase protein TatB